MSAVDVQAAYRHCEGVTRSRARNFYYGIRLLPPAKRGALSAVYAFARRVDDIGDGALEPQDKLDRLATARAELAQLDHHHDPVLVALDDASQKFPLPLKAFGELIEGVEMDVRGTSYPTFDDLAHYCRCVAGSIGRLSLGVFGSSEPHAAPVLADKLGIAMQLTNILRDLREDADNRRVYLPKEDLVRFGLDGELSAIGSSDRVPEPAGAAGHARPRAAATAADRASAGAGRAHGLAAPRQPARPAAPGRRARALPLSWLERAAGRRARRDGAAPPGPGRPAARPAELRRLARRPRPEPGGHRRALGAGRPAHAERPH